MLHNKRPLLPLLTFVFATFFSSNVYADPSSKDKLRIPDSSIFDVIAAEKSENEDLVETHPIIRITPDKSELIRLDREAVGVIVGNPDHLSVLLDTPKVIVLVPRAPGATHFSVLDRNSNLIMQRHVIVASPKQDYIRVRRSCNNADTSTSCNATSVYFCPDMCHEVSVTQLETNESTPSDLPQETPEGPLPTDTAQD